MLTKILIGVVVVIVIFCIIVATRPASFTITRSTTISAPPAVVFAQVNDLHKWEPWNPWGKLDPNAKMTYEGPAAGPGAGYTWAGNKKVGAGRMTITDSRSNDSVKLNLEFKEPFQASNTAEFLFQPEGNQTKVTWSMSGKNNFMFKAVGMFMDCDKMVGKDFEKGLADLKAVSEKLAK